MEPERWLKPSSAIYQPWDLGQITGLLNLSFLDYKIEMITPPYLGLKLSDTRFLARSLAYSQCSIHTDFASPDGGGL